MKSSSKNSTTVQETNDHSILSKHAMVEADYAWDPFLPIFTRQKAPRRAPLINRGYYIRHKAVDTILTSFISTNPGVPKQIVSLGAGFDTAFFRLTQQIPELMKDVFYLEVDFPKLTERKKKLSEGSEMCMQQLGSAFKSNHGATNIKMLTDYYCLLGQDMSDLKGFDAQLKNIQQLKADTKSLVLSECVMTYMEHPDSTKLIKFICDFFPNSAFITYEQIKPDDAFGRVMRAHFDKLNSSLKAVCKYSDKEKQSQRYKDCGYAQADVFSMLDFFQFLPETECHRMCCLEYFDEYEEWHLSCAHYVAIMARSNDSFTGLESIVNKMKDNVAGESASTTNAALDCYSVGSDVQFYGHTSTMIEHDGTTQIITHGGFGESAGHCRQSLLRVYNLSISGNLTLTHTDTHDMPCRLHHTFSTLSDGGVFVFGGRLSPAKPLSDPQILILVTDNDGNSHLRTVNLSSSSNTPKARWRHAAVSYNINNTDYVLISDCRLHKPLDQDRKNRLSGLSTASKEKSSHSLSSCHIYDVQADSWMDLPDLMVDGIYSHAMCYDSDRFVYIVGGLTAQEQVLSDIYRLDIHNPTAGWARLPTKIDAVYSSTCHIVDNKLVVIGGVDRSGDQVGVQIIDLNNSTREDYSLPVTNDTRLRMNFNHTSHVVTQENGLRTVMIVGGGGNCYSFGTHLNKDVIAFDIPHIKA